MTEENQTCRMACSPEQAPVYGGGTIVVAFSDGTEFPPGGELYLVFEGSCERHVVKARQVNEQTLHSLIPAHDTAETAQLRIYLSHQGSSSVLAARHFEYYYDTAHHLAWFLIDSVTETHALEDLELVRSECFDLANEILSTLDDRLCQAFEHLTLPENWNVLGEDANENEPESRDTLFHFCARLGLDKLANFLLDKPGSEAALKLHNRHGFTPKEIAMENNFQGLTELLSGCNTGHSQSQDGRRLEFEKGVFYQTGNGVTTLTTIHEHVQRTVEQDIQSLSIIEERVRSNSEQNINRFHQRQFETDWPVRARSLSEGIVQEIISDTLTSEEQIEGKEQNTKETGQFNEALSENGSTQETEVISNGFTKNLEQDDEEEEVSSTLPEQADFTESLHISEEDETPEGDETPEVDEIPEANETPEVDETPEDDNLFEEEEVKHLVQAPVQTSYKPQLSPQSPRMVEIPEETISMPVSSNQNTTSVLEASLRQLRGINTGLQRIRTNKLHQTVLQEFRRENLQRFSSSCPSLDDQGRQSPLSPVREEDYHKSMLDLIQEAEPSAASLLPDSVSELDPDTIEASQYETHPVRDGVGTQESDVRIFVNDVTVDSTEDGNPSTAEEILQEYEPLKRREPSRKSVRRRSWCPDSRMRNVVHDQRRDIKAEMLKTNGRSLSLSSLENGLVSEEDDSFHDARENPTPSQSQVSLSNSQMIQPMDEDLSPGEMSPQSRIGGNSSDCFHELDPGQQAWNVQPRSERSFSTSASLDTSPSSRTPTQDNKAMSPVKMRAQAIVSSQGSSLDNDHKSAVNSLVVPHSSLMQKSRSTPSLPEAANSLKPRQDVQMRKDSPTKRNVRDKQLARPVSILDKHVSLRNAIAEYDAQFRRQEEVEEDEDETLNQLLKNEEHKKSQMSLTDFLNDGTYDSDEKVKSKEEKKRRPSVFSKLTRGSHRGRKSKDKENKQKGQTHQFVSVSFSNSTSCNVCGRSLANKPALRCESCMINVHENSCKEQIVPCPKFKQPAKVPRDGNGPLAQGNAPKEKPSIFSQASSGLRNVPSFKEKRSVSAPTRQQQMQFLEKYRPVGTGLNRSNTTPTSKVINEEGENDNMHRQDMESNMQDTLSVSMESLEEGTSQVTDFDDDPELMLTQEEPEAWSVTVDKKTLKKMHAKDIKRQDTIWELIQTELNYCRSLKILQMMFSRGMLTELHMSQETVDKLFPNLDDLIDMHMTFLRSLRQLQSHHADKSIDEIGPTLVKQFSDEMGSGMKAAYGRFCSLKEKSVQLYKDFLKNDRKFQNFIKRCNMNILCQRREIPGFLLHISLRITKYPILIESILKTTKDKRDRESLSQALFLSKALLEDVDAQIDAYQREQRLLEIYNKLEGKSTVYFKGKRFKKSDILSRKLIHEGVISWKNARAKLVDVIAVVLSDVIIFLQENNQKYTFFSQDNKSCVISLYKLLVREKGDTRDSKGGIYLISQNKTEPEMYELVCKPSDKRETWINAVRTAAEQCPEEDEAVPLECDEERRLQEARASKLKYIIEQMQRKDQEIKACCDEKNRLFTELLELYTKEEPPMLKLRQNEKVEQQEVGDVLQAAIQEASRLTVMLQSGNGPTNLSRSVSSAGEHVSASYMTPPVPKRAETFAGFDSHDVPKVGVLKKRYGTQVCGEDERSVSPVQYSGREVTSGEAGSGDSPNYKDASPLSHRHSSQPPQPSRPLGDRDEPDGRGSDPDIDQDVLGELPLSSAALVPPSRDQVVSIAQLAQYLHTIVHLTAQQGTAVESLRAQLAEANERINKLSADMHDRKNVYRHNQLEELRNLQATVSRDRAKIDGEKAKIFEERRQLEQDRAELAAKKEELQRQKEFLQKQVDFFNEHRETSTTSAADKKPPRPLSGTALGKVQSSSSFYVPSGLPSDQISHKRSASAEYPHTGGLEAAASSGPTYNKHVSQPGGSGRDSHARPMHRFSVASFSGTHGPTDAQKPQQQLPMHLLSCTNEQRVGSVNAVPQGGSVQQVLPFKLASNSGGSPAAQGGAGSAQGQASQGSPNLGLPTHLSQSGPKVSSSTSSSSGLGQVMRNRSLLKLAEPISASRARTTSQPNVEKVTNPGMPAEQHSTPQQSAPSGEIYF
ncbi:A-kinase anchor protein 13-like isoform X2 [Liolophura sinensis]|uniref:A-kinase anchor protein 13-like isoform X2 n=1 Tax=Liolophura sinensis TaxID=3198878 RepID=UPI00315807C9